MTPARDAGLGDEVEAFLHGCLVEHLVSGGRPVPAWAVLNKPAHADLDELTELVTAGDAAGGQPDPAEPAWLQAQRALAAAVVTGASAPVDISAMQRAVLVPLELWVIQRTRSGPATSRWVVELALDAVTVLSSTA